MSENIKKSAMESETRLFSMFKGEDGLDKEVVTKNIGTLHELKKLLYEDGGDPFPNVDRLIAAFEQSKIKGKLSERSVDRRPHILVAGGFIRDVLTGKKPKDIDFVSNATYEEIYFLLIEQFKDEMGKTVWFDEIGKQFGIISFAFLSGEKGELSERYEIASLRSDSETSDGRKPTKIEQETRPGKDVERRDLTVNALLYNPRTGTVVDYVGGLKDITDKKLRFVGDPNKRIREDKLRALRYIRFLFKTGFEEDPSALEAIRKAAEEVVRVLPGERISQEMNTMFLNYPPAKVLETFERYGLLKVILPEIAALRDCPQGAPYHMEGDVLEHTFGVVRNLPQDSPLELIWAAIMHDVEKPSTRAAKKDEVFGERVSFHGHEEKGAKTFLQVFGNMKNYQNKRFQASNEFLETVEWLIANHLRIFSFADMTEGKAQRLANHPAFPLLINLGFADARASKPHTALTEEAYGGEYVEKLFTRIKARYEEIRRFQETHVTVLDEVKKATNGFEIMKKYKEIHGKDLKGRHVGTLKNMIEEAVNDARITDPQKAALVLEKIVKDYSI